MGGLQFDSYCFHSTYFFLFGLIILYLVLMLLWAQNWLDVYVSNNLIPCWLNYPFNCIQSPLPQQVPLLIQFFWTVSRFRPWLSSLRWAVPDTLPAFFWRSQAEPSGCLASVMPSIAYLLSQFHTLFHMFFSRAQSLPSSFSNSSLRCWCRSCLANSILNLSAWHSCFLWSLRPSCT